MAAAVVIALSAQADEPPFHDALLDRFAGQWVLTGTIAADGVPGHQFE